MVRLAIEFPHRAAPRRHGVAADDVGSVRRGTDQAPAPAWQGGDQTIVQVMSAMMPGPESLHDHGNRA